MTNFLNAVEAQEGVPLYAKVILGIIAAIVVLVLAIKSFWISKTISISLSIFGIVLSIMGFKHIDSLLAYTIIGGLCFGISYIFLMGNIMFDSETEGDYLIAGSLVHDTNHPFKAFCGYVGGIAALSGFIFWAAYRWTFVIALVAFILTLALNIGLIIERIRG